MARLCPHGQLHLPDHLPLVTRRIYVAQSRTEMCLRSHPAPIPVLPSRPWPGKMGSWQLLDRRLGRGGSEGWGGALGWPARPAQASEGKSEV